MGNFTFSEIITIIIVILIVFGPQRLPEIARKAGAWASKARAAIDSVKTELDAEYGEVIQPLREARQEIRSAGTELKGQITAFGQELEQTGKEVTKAANEAVKDVKGATSETVNPPSSGLKAGAEKAVNQIAAANASPAPQPSEPANGEVSAPSTDQPDESVSEVDGG